MTGDSDSGPALARQLGDEVGAATGPLDSVRVAEVRDDPVPTADGTRCYALDGPAGRIAEVYVYPGRVRIEFSADPPVAAKAGERVGLRVRPKAVQPPRTLVFVESPDEIQAALDVIRTVVTAGE